MRIDFYTKAVLTVIATCLVWMCLTGVTPEVQAQANRPAPTQVVLVDERGIPVPTAQGLRVNLGPQPIAVAVSNPSVPVTIGNAPLPVQLAAIQRVGQWDAIAVQVLRDPPTQRPTP
jgi:hypothetical protein